MKLRRIWLRGWWVLVLLGGAWMALGMGTQNVRAVSPVLSLSDPLLTVTPDAELDVIPEGEAISPDFIRLPENCTDVTTGESPSCCVFGHVYFYLGDPLLGVSVTIQGADGGIRVVTTTMGTASEQPYFVALLNRPPLSVTAGSWITFSAASNSLSTQLVYQTQPEGQRVDLTLPVAGGSDYIYFVKEGEPIAGREIWRMHFDGSEQEFLQNGYDPKVCSVTGRVVYVYNGNIHVMEGDGTYIGNLTMESSGFGSYSSFNPDWSPDCTQIVYAATFPEGDLKLVMMNANGANKTQLIAGASSAYRNWYPDWSSDGKWIIYTSDWVTGTSGNIARLEVSTGITRQLAGSGGWYPVWSPDNRHIAYVRFADPKQTVYIMKADGSQKSPCTRSDVTIWWPYWLSNSKLMYVYPGAIEVVNVAETMTGTVCTNVVRITTGGSMNLRSPATRHTYPPRATIHTIFPRELAVQGTDVVTFYGSGQDSDEAGGRIVNYLWQSSLNGVLGTGAKLTIPANQLVPGIHTISFKVQDNEGDWSREVTRTLTVVDAQGNNPAYWLWLPVVMRP